MRPTQKLIRLALLAILLIASPQRGNSAVVGYVNVSAPAGLILLNNALDADGTDSISTVFGPDTVPDGTKVYIWDVTNQVFFPPAEYFQATGWTTTSFGALSTNYVIPPGRGFFLSSPSSWTVTFVGTVLTGTQTNFIVGTNKFSLLGSKSPVAAQLSPSGSLTFPKMDGADLFLYNTTNQSYIDAYTYFTNYGWFDPASQVNTNGPTLNVGQGFFIQNPGPGTNWISSFVVQTPSAPQVSQATVVKPAPQINHLAIAGNQITLQILNPGGAPYDIQFSSDQSSWLTVASGQTNATWTSILTGGTRGYYQVVSH